MQMRTVLTSLSLSLLLACGADPLGSPTVNAHLNQAVIEPANGAVVEPGADRRPLRHDRELRHVLLLSIDGMHEIDLARFIAEHRHSTLARLARHGVRYTNAWVNRLDGTATNPSDSFPGLLALATGGSSPTHGGWYDVSYARDLYPGGSACAGAAGTMVAYDESIDGDDSHLWGSAVDDTPTHDSTVARARIDRVRLPRARHGADCAPVYPHQFIRVNTIFEVAKAFGRHTAWSDKHLAYELVNGPSGVGVDDFFAPEINSDPSKSLIPSAPAGGAFTDKWSYTEIYDDYKVQAILNQIDGRFSDDGLAGARDTDGAAPGTPAIFGMNFQALSVAQKDASADGGYRDGAGAPGPEVADALAHTDASIGKMVADLERHHLYDSTLIIVTAKHGQSPIDKSLHRAVDGAAVAALIDAAAPVAGHIEDDVGLYWLAHAAMAPAARAALLSAPASVDPRADAVYTSADPRFVDMFGDPTRDPRTPDVIVAVEKGTIYSLSQKKDAEHGGFADDDAHVALLVANPRFDGDTVDEPVRTKQVAPTILRALTIDPRWLDAVRREGTRPLPDLDL